MDNFFDRQAGGRGGFPVWRLVFGLLVMGYGALLLADNLHWAPAYFLLDRWYGPAAVIIVGVAALAQASTRGGRYVGGTVVVAGLLWLAESAAGVHIDFDDLWPLAIVAAGLWVIFHSIESRDEATPQTTGASQASGMAFWSRIHRRIVTPAFSRADFAAVMGGIEVDLRPAATANGRAVVEVLALMGGIEITVPPDWAVSNQAIAIMGGVEDKTSGPPSAAHLLVVRGIVCMGGVVIKN